MMSEFDPASISQDELHRLRAAAEAAWGDDTRSPSYEGHPLPAMGQCHVTASWLVKKLGGHVGFKAGHYFWVSPDKQYVIDLTGDQFVYTPHDLKWHGIKLDEDDSGWEPTEDHKKWRSGPVMFKHANHPLFRDFRVKSPRKDARTKVFQQRADQAYAEGA